jgi:transposase-like protein
MPGGLLGGVVTRSYVAQGSRRFPPAVEGIEYNRCANPLCTSFGRPPNGDVVRRQRNPDNPYGLTGTGAGLSFRCRACGEYGSMWSNLAVHEELARLSARRCTSPACATAQCPNIARPILEHPEEYQHFGVTSSGSKRFRCKRCGATRSLTQRATHRLRRPEATETVLRLLVNKSPMRRLCEVAGIGPETLYQRISLLHERLHDRIRAMEERYLASAMFDRLHIAVDRQEHALGMGTATDRRVFVLRAAAATESKSGYVLAQHVNYDPGENAMARELEARALGDPEIAPAYRRFARLLLPYELEEEADPSVRTINRRASAGAEHIALAGDGAFVHSKYTMLAHFLYLRRWTDRAERVQFSMDDENGIERACLLTFDDRVRAGSVDAYLVRIDKTLSVPQRRTVLAQAEAELAALRKKHPGLADADLVRAVMAARYVKACRLPQRKTRWVDHPYPTMQEPKRRVLCLTDDGHRSRERVANGLARATLRSTDRYFMQVRRKVSVLERPLYSAGSQWRAFFAYNAYSPRVVMEVLAIFRAVYNFHLVGRDGRTPAQRLGIASERLSRGDLIDGGP